MNSTVQAPGLPITRVPRGTHWRPHLYALQNERGEFKIGFSSNLSQRIPTLNRKHRCRWNFVGHFQVRDRWAVTRHERVLHRVLAEYAIGGECFRGDPVVVRFVRRQVRS